MKRKCFALGAQGRLIGRLAACVAVSLAALGAGPALAHAASPGDRSDGASASRPVVLGLGAGFARAGGSRPVRVLQRRLRGLGQRPGPVDGLFGPLTRAAVERFQAEHGLLADGVVGARTRTALRHPRAHEVLRSGAGYELRGGSRAVRGLQRALGRVGQHPGKVDGLYGPLTERAVSRFQARVGLTADGVAGPKTRRAIATRAPKTPTSSTPKAPTRSTPKAPTRSTPKAPVAPAPSGTRTRPVGGDDPLPTWLIALASALALGCLVALLPARRRKTAARLESGAVRAHGKAREPHTDEEIPEPHTDEEIPEPHTDEEAAEPHTDEEIPEPQIGEEVVEPVLTGPVAPVEVVPVIGYVSVPQAVAEQAGDDTSEQTEAIDVACSQRGLLLLEVVRDVEVEARKALERPGLSYALGKIAAGAARGLVVSRLESVSRSATDIGVLVEQLKDDDARFVAVDFGLDTGTQAGRIAARTLMTVCDMERRRLSEHTRRGLAAARAKGSATGRPAVADHAELKARIATLRAEGKSYQAIADLLDAEGIPTLRGGTRWRPSSVQAAAGYKRPPTTKNGRSNRPPRGGA